MSEGIFVDRTTAILSKIGPQPSARQPCLRLPAVRNQSAEEEPRPITLIYSACFLCLSCSAKCHEPEGERETSRVY